jgi:hypothetical protein
VRKEKKMEQKGFEPDGGPKISKFSQAGTVKGGQFRTKLLLE